VLLAQPQHLLESPLAPPPVQQLGPPVPLQPDPSSAPKHLPLESLRELQLARQVLAPKQAQALHLVLLLPRPRPLKKSRREVCSALCEVA
jgi:hypothetical protein